MDVMYLFLYGLLLTIVGFYLHIKYISDKNDSVGLSNELIHYDVSFIFQRYMNMPYYSFPHLKESIQSNVNILNNAKSHMIYLPLTDEGVKQIMTEMNTTVLQYTKNYNKTYEDFEVYEKSLYPNHYIYETQLNQEFQSFIYSMNDVYFNNYIQNVIHSNENPKTNQNPYLLVLGTTYYFNITKEDNTNEIQLFIQKAMSLMHTYYNIKIVAIMKTTQCGILNNTNIDCLPNVSFNEFNVPVYSSVMKLLETNYQSLFYGYINGDILFGSSLITNLQYILSEIHSKHIKPKVQLFFRRTNIDFKSIRLNVNTLSLQAIDSLMTTMSTGKKPVFPHSVDLIIVSKGSYSYKHLRPVVVGRYFVESYLMSYSLYYEAVIDSFDMTFSTPTYHLTATNSVLRSKRYYDFYYNCYSLVACKSYGNMTLSYLKYYTVLQDAKNTILNPYRPVELSQIYTKHTYFNNKTILLRSLFIQLENLYTYIEQYESK